MPEEKPPRRWLAGALFAGFFLVSLGFQVRSGAWRSDFGGHADEAAHVVTSLMVRDYLAGGFLSTPHPMRYAEGYYERFPKVAIGHYPPGFYLAAAGALLPFRSGETLLLFMNLLNAGAALLVWSFGRRLLGHGGLAAVPALLYGALPQTRTYTAIVMSDLMLVLLGLLAARSFCGFLRTGRARDSLCFGLWSAGAILTKGSGVGLALLPLFALLLSGRWRMALNPRLWLAPLPVLFLALPWMLFTMSITREGMQETGLLEWMRAALPFYGRAMGAEAGWVALAALAGAALARGFVRRRRLGEVEATLWALLACGLAVPLVVPTGLDHRYLMPLMPSVVLLGAAWIRGIAERRGKAFGTGAILVFAALVFGDTYRPVRKLYTGASPAIRAILQDAEPEGAAGPGRLLVVSDARGEGALVAAAALVAPERIALDRGTKLLSTSDWVGRDYRPAFRSFGEFREILAKRGIGYLVIDPPEENTPLEHWRTSYDWLAKSSEEPFRPIAEVDSWRRDQKRRFLVFRIDPITASGTSRPRPGAATDDPPR